MTPEEALAVLGLSSFRHQQEKIISDILQTPHRDFLCCLPTSYGKSLLYLIPVIALGRPALVVSPLVSLIQDQCAKVNAKGAKIAYNISSSDEDGDEKLVFSPHVYNGNTPVLMFCTPEKVASAAFQGKLQTMHAHRPLSFFILDEAHQIEAGQSFRPDYLGLGILRQKFPAVPFLCFSATCQAYTQRLLVRVLKLKDLQVVKQEEARENMHFSLHYTSKKKPTCSCKQATCSWIHGSLSAHASMLASVSHSEGGEVLIATNSRKDCEILCSDLQRLLPRKTVCLYHGQLDDITRASIQKQFVDGSIDILCATWASFGTGVDMPKLTRVVMYGVPLDFSTFVQTIGRGGRAGQEYFVDVYVREADLVKQRSVMEKERRETRDASYTNHLQNSFQQSLSLVNAAVASRTCLSAHICALMYAGGTELNVRYEDLQKFKAVNNRLSASCKARWDGNKKKWVLPPGAYDARLACYGAVEVTQTKRCDKCSACVLHAQCPSRCGGTM